MERPYHLREIGKMDVREGEYPEGKKFVIIDLDTKKDEGIFVRLNGSNEKSLIILSNDKSAIIFDGISNQE